jgi:hypothetical protein
VIVALVTVAFVPLNSTTLLTGVVEKFVPVIVTEAPTGPDVDAQRNRERILEVAKLAFTRSGANARRVANPSARHRSEHLHD